MWNLMAVKYLGDLKSNGYRFAPNMSNSEISIRNKMCTLFIFGISPTSFKMKSIQPTRAGYCGHHLAMDPWVRNVRFADSSPERGWIVDPPDESW